LENSLDCDVLKKHLQNLKLDVALLPVSGRDDYQLKLEYARPFSIGCLLKKYQYNM